MTNEELDSFFRSNKSNWYLIDSKGEKKWDTTLLKKYYSSLPKFLELNKNELKKI